MKKYLFIFTFFILFAVSKPHEAFASIEENWSDKNGFGLGISESVAQDIAAKIRTYFEEHSNEYDVNIDDGLIHINVYNDTDYEVWIWFPNSTPPTFDFNYNYYVYTIAPNSDEFFRIAFNSALQVIDFYDWGAGSYGSDIFMSDEKYSNTNFFMFGRFTSANYILFNYTEFYQMPLYSPLSADDAIISPLLQATQLELDLDKFKQWIFANKDWHDLGTSVTDFRMLDYILQSYKKSGGKPQIFKNFLLFYDSVNGTFLHTQYAEMFDTVFKWHSEFNNANLNNLVNELNDRRHKDADVEYGIETALTVISQSDDQIIQLLKSIYRELINQSNILVLSCDRIVNALNNLQLTDNINSTSQDLTDIFTVDLDYTDFNDFVSSQIQANEDIFNLNYDNNSLLSASFGSESANDDSPNYYYQPSNLLELMSSEPTSVAYFHVPFVDEVSIEKGSDGVYKYELTSTNHVISIGEDVTEWDENNKLHGFIVNMRKFLSILLYCWFGISLFWKRPDIIRGE